MVLLRLVSGRAMTTQRADRDKLQVSPLRSVPYAGRQQNGYRMRNRPRAAAQLTLPFLPTMFAASLLGGCASSLNVVGDPFVAPAKFQFLRCEDIAKRLVSTQTREQELRVLMDRAETGTGGTAVNILVYQPDYQTVQSELRQLREAAVEKRCPNEPRKAGSKADSDKAR